MTKQEILEMFEINTTPLENEVEFLDTKDSLDGAHNKDFVMLDREEFKDLYSPKSKKDKYITYMDNIRKEGLSPQKISILKKTLWDKSAMAHEVIASRIMNYFGCPTVFNAPYKATKGFKFDMIASVDCVSENETFENFYRLIDMTDERVYTLWRKIEVYMQKFSDYPKFKSDFERFEEDYFKSHVVREFIIGDIDLGSHNIGLLLNEKEQRFKFVSFDYEHAFFTKRGEYSDLSMQWLAKHKPQILRDVYGKSIVLRDLILSERENIENSDKTTNDIVNNVIDKLLVKLNEFIDNCNQMLNYQVK